MSDRYEKNIQKVSSMVDGSYKRGMVANKFISSSRVESSEEKSLTRLYSSPIISPKKL